MHDACTKKSMHHEALISVFAQRVNAIGDEGVNAVPKVKTLLMSLSPIRHCTDKSQNVRDSKEAETFNADVVVEHVEDAFKNANHLVPQDWIHCFLGDNANANLAMAELLNKPHMSCHNHLLNLEVEDVIDDNEEASYLLNDVRSAVSSARNSAKLSAVLRDSQEEDPLQNASCSCIIDNDARWLSKGAALDRFAASHDELVSVSLDPTANLMIPHCVRQARHPSFIPFHANFLCCHAT